jgi:hypothetical protein
MRVAAIDEFASSLLEEAKRFLEKATARDGGEQAYLHAALTLGFCALDAISDEFSTRGDLSIADQSILTERDIRLEHGEFKLGPLKMYRLEDRILFLHLRFSGTPLNRNSTWWGELSSAISLRNQLTHPRAVPEITHSEVSRAISAIIDTIDALFQAIYQQQFPVANRRLQSRLDFYFRLRVFATNGPSISAASACESRMNYAASARTCKTVTSPAFLAKLH